MGLNVSPAYRLVANSKDITATIETHFKSLHLSDSTGLDSDTLEVSLADTDPDNRIKRPPKGAEIELWLGYDENVTRMGLFIFDEFDRTGWPASVTFRARAAVYDQTAKGKTDLQTQKSRSWPNNIKLGDMVAKIAKEHGMAAVVAPSMASIRLPHYDQTGESDLSFLLRVLKHYDGMVKPSGGKLVVAKRGESKTASGDDLPTITIDATNMTNFRCNWSEKESPGTVVAFYHSTKQSKRIEVRVGSGDPVLRVRHYFPTQDAARRAAQAELDKRARRLNKFSCTLPGDPQLVAEGRLIVTGFGDADVDGEWLITRVDHSVDGSGYHCGIEAEKPNQAADDAAAK